MKSEKGMYIRLIKGFKFPEPVFYSEKLERNFRFLANSAEIKRKIDRIGKYPWEPIQNYGYLKPIRNPRIKYDQFWEPFQRSLFSGTHELGFRMYPFQIIPSPSEQIETHIQKTLFEGVFNIKFQSIYSQYQIRLYPSGVGTVHLMIYLKLPLVIDVEKILNIVLKRKWVNSPFLVINNSSVNFPKWAESMYVGILRQISNHHEANREIRGSICGINLQGNFPTSEIREVLENFAKRKKANSTFLEEDHEDIIYLDKNLLFLYLDMALQKRRRWRYLKKPDFILHGRRCLRCHLLNIVELGYCSAYLLTFYSNVAKDLFGKPQDSKWSSTLEKIVNIHSYLEIEQWKKVYACELYEQGINRGFVNALQNSLKELRNSSPEQSCIDGILTKLTLLGQLLATVANFF